MRPLQVIADCTLTPSGLEAQRARAGLLRRSVAWVERRPLSLAVRFGGDVDRAVLDTLIETERGCCGFLAIDYDDTVRVLRIGIDDERHTDVLDAFSQFFAKEAA